MKKSLVSFVSLLLLVSLAACNMPASPTQAAPELGTAAALTVQAVLTPLNSPTAVPPTSTVGSGASSTPNTPLGTPPVAQGTPTTTATISQTPTITPTYSVPILKINESTNCRTGPGQNYEIIFAFLPGATAEIVGQYPQDNYWVVKLPDSGGTCWAWGGYATTSGSFWVVPTMTPPPTTTPNAPDAPTGLSVYYSCGAGGDITVTLNWHDNSDGEDGFRVLRDDAMVAQLPPNTTTFVDNFYGVATQKYSYVIEVFSGNLTARSTPNKYSTFSCQ